MARSKIAIYVDNFLPNGQIWVWRQMTGLRLDFIVLAHQRTNKEVYPFEDVYVREEKKNDFLEKIKYKLPNFVKLWQPELKDSAVFFSDILQKEKIGLVHAHFGTNGTAILSLCESLKIPLVVTFHGFDITSVPQRWPGYKKKLKRLFAKAKVIIAVSEYIKKLLISAGCPPEKIRLSYLGVPVNHYPFVDRKEKKGPVRFLHLGRIVEKKGVPDLIRAYHEAFRNNEEAILQIIGSGEELTYSRELASTLGISNRVEFKEEVPNSEVWQILSEADVFVLNSRTDSQMTTEGLPVALLEAMASGLPVISTEHAGIPESIIHDYNGLLVKEKDIDGLAKAMVRLMDDSHRLALGLNARSYMKEKFDLQKCNLQLQEIYEEGSLR